MVILYIPDVHKEGGGFEPRPLEGRLLGPKSSS